MAEKQLYAAVQLHVQSTLMLEREGLQAVSFSIQLFWKQATVITCNMPAVQCLHHVLGLSENINIFSVSKKTLFSYCADILYFIVIFSCVNKVLKVGALQEVRSDLTKLRGALFYKILEDLHCHLYNNGEYR
jgi:hypothetical protein